MGSNGADCPGRYPERLGRLTEKEAAMDGLCNVAAADGILTIDGKDYRPSIPTAADFGELERHVVGLRGNPLKELASCLDDFPAASRQMALKVACDSIAGRSPRATFEEMEEFMGSPAGIVFMLYVMLRRNHPEISSQGAANDLLGKLNAAEVAGVGEVMQVLAKVETAVKNSPSTEQVTETKDPHESRGLESIAT